MTTLRDETTAIVMGGSAGGLDAVQTILSALPPTWQLPVAVVLHVLPGRPSGLVNVLGGYSPLQVKEAEDKEPLAAGTVYVAAPNYHLLVEKDRRLALSADEPVHYSRPSIDVLFESAADAFGRRLIGVLLSGANEDGARGLLTIRRAGGTTIVQSPETSPSPQMPEAALRLDAADHVLDIASIGTRLRALVGLSSLQDGSTKKVNA